MDAHELLLTRRLEVFLGGTTTVFGAWLLMPWDAMSTASFAVILSAAPEYVWGGLFFLNGLSHLAALAINGRRWWSPFMRWGVTMTTALVYLAFCLGFTFQNWATTAVPIYGGLAVGHFICMYLAWIDARIAVGVRFANRHA